MNSVPEASVPTKNEFVFASPIAMFHDHQKDLIAVEYSIYDSGI